MIQFSKATRKALKGRIAIDGPSGSGKTFTALRMAFSIVAPGKRVVVISSESGAVEKYVGLAPDGTIWDFDIGYLPDFSPDTYTKAILAAGKAGYDVIVIDSLSHAWAGEGGALELVDRAASRSQSQNTYFAWRDITPMHNRMLEAIVRSPAHIIGTMRSKTEYVIENVGGKSVPKKVGMSPIQRAGMEYEFDLYCSMNLDHVCFVSKTRCPALDGMMQVKPGAEFIEPFGKWLAEGVSVPDGYYSADEADMKKLEQAEEDAKSPEEKAAEAEANRKAAMEKQRAALKRTTAPAPEVSTYDAIHAPPTASPSPASPSEATKPAVAMIDATLKNSIAKLYTDALKAGKFTREQLSAFLAANKAVATDAEGLGNLTQEKGGELKGLLLNATMPAEVGNAATEAHAISDAKAVTIVIPEPDVVHNERQEPHDRSTLTYVAPGTITRGQHARIAELIKILPPPVWPNDKRKEFLAGYKVASFNSISNYVAEMLIRELEKLAGEKGLTGTANVPAAGAVPAA